MNNGLKCKCGGDTKIIESNKCLGLPGRRIRKCEKCNKNFKTYEIHEEDVKKKDRIVKPPKKRYNFTIGSF